MANSTRFGPCENCARILFTGLVDLPIFSAAFTGVALTSGFGSGSIVTYLQQGTAGTAANALATNSTYFENMKKGGCPANFFLVNPEAAGGSATVLRNGSNFTYHALQMELRRAPRRASCSTSTKPSARASPTSTRTRRAPAPTTTPCATGGRTKASRPTTSRTSTRPTGSMRCRSGGATGGRLDGGQRQHEYALKHLRPDHLLLH